jgi:CspA family cold shock protein
MNALTPTTIHAVAKWFDPARGFGFVTAPGIPGDILLPGPRLEAAGRGSLAEGIGLTVEIRTTPRGVQVERVISIDATPPAGAPVAARVKWFNAREGFGFVQLLG